MKVDPATTRGFAFDHPFGDAVILRTNKKIYVTVRPERRLRVQTRDGPAFEENRLDACGAHEPKDLLDFALMDVGLQREQTKRLMQQLARRRVAQLGFAYAPPA